MNGAELRRCWGEEAAVFVVEGGEQSDQLQVVSDWLADHPGVNISSVNVDWSDELGAFQTSFLAAPLDPVLNIDHRSRVTLRTHDDKQENMIVASWTTQYERWPSRKTTTVVFESADFHP